MTFKKKIFILFAGIASLLTSACSSNPISSSTSISYSNGWSYSNDSYSSFSWDDDRKNYSKLADQSTYYTLRDVNYPGWVDNLPSKGEVDVLVIPIEVQGYSFSETTLTCLEHAFNGDGAKETGYWESVASFYFKSSYGQFLPTFKIAPAYKSKKFPSQIKFLASAGEDAASKLVDLALADYKENNDIAPFDANQDGWVDAVIGVYSCPDYQNSTIIKHADSDGDLFWAMTSWAENKRDPLSPSLNLFSWISYDFLFKGCKSPKADAHTFIHEFGHMLGLDDYYGVNGNYPAGGWIMEDCNIMDHDIFSKALLGWCNPYVANGSCTISINPSVYNGDAIIIPAKNTFNGTVFSEYLILELYTPTCLNENDATKGYLTYHGQSKAGIRLWHVDARIMKTKDWESFDYYSEKSLASGYAYVVAASNHYKGSSPTDKDFDLIDLIDRSPRSSFRSNNSSLFETGDCFSNISYSDYFSKKTTFNDGSPLNFSISFISVGDDYATIEIAE